MVRNHYERFFHHHSGYEGLKDRVWELCEFLHDVLQVRSLPHAFPRRVGLHASCHGLRELRLGACSERVGHQSNKVRDLLQLVPGIELVPLQRPDECCGFGGTFAVSETGVSAMMGRDRIRDHLEAGAEVITATDSSCLMHLEGLVRRAGQPVQVLHIAEILAGMA